VDTRLRSVADRPDVAKVLSGGVSSADHMLRIKPRSAVVLDLASPASAVKNYADDYRAYFARHADSLPADLSGSEGHDPLPRVLLVPGLGAVTTGRDERDAKVAADIAVRTHGVAARVLDAFGEVESLPEAEDFAFDYWPMELYKLALRPPAPRFAGTVQIVTGAASGIGRTIALTLAKAGASVVAADLDADGLASLADEAEAAGGPRPATVVGDQSDETVVLETTRTAIRTFGGLDGVVLSAGIGVSAPLEDLSLDRWQQALEVNLTSSFLLTREAIRAMRVQGRGGSLVYVASKNAFAPGAGFGAYSVTKAGMLQLMRIAALEGGEVGIRANAVNPDAVFDGSRLWEGGLREERAAAHGIAPDKLEDFYASRNLLHRKVTSHDVAAAVAYLLSADSACTSGSVLPVDGGVAAAFPR
jgi:NAD(P)-dependent dehydrogenase (short-subunit alcohol dehydrogenase family)